MATTCIIIPVKDEEEGLKFLYEDFKNSELYTDSNLSFIFIIDSRTNDASKDIASKFTNQIIDQESTHGKGAAIRQALELWMLNQTSHVILMDADGSYSFSDVSKIMKALRENHPVVSGSRFLNNGRPDGMSILHNFGNHFLSLICSIKNRRKISDLCTGLWGFTSEAIIKLNLKAVGFDLEAEIAGKVSKNAFHHHEVQVNWSARKGGVSKLKSFRDGFLILYRILRT